MWHLLTEIAFYANIMEYPIVDKRGRVWFFWPEGVEYACPATRKRFRFSFPHPVWPVVTGHDGKEVTVLFGRELALFTSRGMELVVIEKTVPISHILTISPYLHSCFFVQEQQVKRRKLFLYCHTRPTRDASIAVGPNYAVLIDMRCGVMTVGQGERIIGKKNISAADIFFPLVGDRAVGCVLDNTTVVITQDREIVFPQSVGGIHENMFVLATPDCVCAIDLSNLNSVTLPLPAKGDGEYITYALACPTNDGYYAVCVANEEGSFLTRVWGAKIPPMSGQGIPVEHKITQAPFGV